MTYHLDIHPPDVRDNLPPDESGDSCPHSEIICAACEEEDARAKADEKPRYYEEAKTAVNEWFNYIDPPHDGVDDHSCNKCETESYLCPHLHERLVQGVAAAMERIVQEAEKETN